MQYDHELHHRRSIRLRDYDYANIGAYFVTACCQNRINYFGDIENEKMILNEYGNIAHNELAKTPEIRTNVELCEFVVMPNHIHAIIRIMEFRGVLHTLNAPKSPSNTIGAIIRGYKSAVSKQIRECGGGGMVMGGKKMFRNVSIWQRNYWEHIIRNETEYTKIAEYIRNNPILWGKKCLDEILPKIRVNS